MLEAEASVLAFSQHLTSEAQPRDFLALNGKYINAKEGRQSQLTQLHAVLHATSRMGLFLEAVLSIIDTHTLLSLTKYRRINLLMSEKLLSAHTEERIKNNQI